MPLYKLSQNEANRAVKMFQNSALQIEVINTRTSIDKTRSTKKSKDVPTNSSIFRWRCYGLGSMAGDIYVRNIIEQIIVIFYAAVDDQFLFLYDNVWPHRVAIVEESRNLRGIPQLALPPSSPDLILIEYGWIMLQRRLSNHISPLQILQQLYVLLSQL